MFGVAVLSFWHVHAKDYALEAKEHPGAEVTAVWDEDRKRGQVEASQRGVPFHDDLEGLLSREDVDGVVVTTPTVAHREIIPAAARAGKHVFAEKVIAPTLSEAREVVAEVEEAGVTFVISLPRLYTGYTRAIREVLASGEIGEPTYLRVRVSHDGAVPSTASPLGWLPERFFDPRQSAGGVTIDFGAHPLYLLAHLLGMPDEVSAVYGRFTGRAVEDQSVVTVYYPHGAWGLRRLPSWAPPRHFLWRHKAPKEVSSTTRAVVSERAAGTPSDGATSGCQPTEGRPSDGGWSSPQQEGLIRRTSEPPSS